ncbi:MAG: plasmid mobilization relaxosome protein MobC [Pseudomonadota bacterium]|nr:plasmid mobilization relaxosome protein MobC [Pseudomonadota bacterium]QKK06349.1 MAG: plasmid mobilization relaxosome protein MobC [Pseudomonadota bacterium]
MEAKGQNKGAERSSPVTFRATDGEKQALRDSAGRMPVSAYIRFMLFDMPSPRRAISYVENKELIEHLLHRLGNSRISGNLNQIAKACNSGALPLDAETHALLHEACHAVLEMREELSVALGRPIKTKVTQKSRESQ